MGNEDQKLPPLLSRDSSFFVLYRDIPEEPWIRIQLEDGQTYDVHVDEFDTIPQYTNLPLWEKCLRLACAEGQAVYSFGKDSGQDEILSVPVERPKHVQKTVTLGLRQDAIRHSRTQRVKARVKNSSPRRYSAL